MSQDSTGSAPQPGVGVTGIEGIPEAVVHPELQQLQRGDEAKFALLWHVQVVNEGNKVLASGWPKYTLHTSNWFADIASSNMCSSCGELLPAAGLKTIVQLLSGCSSDSRYIRESYVG